MSTILITGATGHLGTATVKKLIETVNSKNIAVMARSAEKAAHLAQLGVEVREGDYSNYASLVQAFKGIGKLLFISGTDIAQRAQQHENVVKAAKEAGVKHIIYTSFQRKNESNNSPIAFLADSHIKTERWMLESGIVYTILRNNLYADVLPMFLGENVLQSGTIYLPTGNGKAALVLRDDIAEVCAKILATEGHENKIYNIANSVSVSFAEIAALLSEVSGKTVSYISPTADEFVNTLTQAGVPQEAVQGALGFSLAIQQGEFDQPSADIEMLTGRQPAPVKQYLQQVYGVQAAH